MKFLAYILVAALAISCVNKTTNQPPMVIDPLSPEVDEVEYADASVVGAKSAIWLRHASTSRGIEIGDPIAAQCTEPGWAYIFYDNQAVIGYEPFPEAISVMHAAVFSTVELHNRDYPNEEWGYINVAIPAPPPPVASNDPVLSVWQYALCLDDGIIVDGPYTADFDFNWSAFKSGGAALQLESWNQQYAPPTAHIVWGPDQ